jgi:hypothetical protein
MTKQLRVTRNAEASELVAHIRDDAAMMATLTTAIQYLWQQYTAAFAAAVRSTAEPSPLLIPPTTDLIIALIERKVEALKGTPRLSRAATELDALLRTASLYCVADDILQICLPDYRPMAETGHFEVIDHSTRVNKPWWHFW